MCVKTACRWYLLRGMSDNFSCHWCFEEQLRYMHMQSFPPSFHCFCDARVSAWGRCVWLGVLTALWIHLPFLLFGLLWNNWGRSPDSMSAPRAPSPSTKTTGPTQTSSRGGPTQNSTSIVPEQHIFLCVYVCSCPCVCVLAGIRFHILNLKWSQKLGPWTDLLGLCVWQRSNFVAWI